MGGSTTTSSCPARLVFATTHQAWKLATHVLTTINVQVQGSRCRLQLMGHLVWLGAIIAQRY
jgi:hypothetical protein